MCTEGGYGALNHDTNTCLFYFKLECTPFRLTFYRLLISTLTVYLNRPEGSSPIYYIQNIESHSEYFE